jgi:hypothetical protein
MGGRLHMEFVTHNHRFALDIVESNPELKILWEEIVDSIHAISDESIIEEFLQTPTKMSISDAINTLLDSELVSRNWTPQSAIFQGDGYSEKKWRLDFSKRIQNPQKGISGMAIEVAFNHGEAIAWNLMKPVLAAEVNQVELQTQIGSGVGVYICAASDLKNAGGFDGAVGEYEKVLRYLNPMFQKLSVPLIIIGLNAPRTFRIEKKKNPITKRNTGAVVRI